MRHFEEFEFEHLLNGTGSFWFRLRCRSHLKHCLLCQHRMEQTMVNSKFADRIKNGIMHLKQFDTPDENGDPRGPKEL